MQGQATPHGVVSLTTMAPVGGVTVALASSDPTVARVPASVTIGGGTSSASFTVDTSTVTASVAATISASLNGVTRSAALTIVPPPLVAAFSVISPTKGPGACLLGPDTDQADCRLDGSASSGFVGTWHWSYWTVAGSPLTRSVSDAGTSLSISSRCAFFDGARGGDDANGEKFIQMEVELVVQDRVGNRSAPVRQPVRLYPNRFCGFNY